MKFSILIPILLLLNSNLTLGQCSNTQLFPFKLGISKFEAINELHLKDNVYDITDNTSNSDDSIQSVSFRYKYNSCFKNYQKNLVDLKFLNKKLTKIRIIYTYKPEDFKQCLNDYKQIRTTLEKNYQIKLKYTNQEDNGEGFYYFKTTKENKQFDNQEKFDGVKLGYEFWSENHHLKPEFRTSNGKIQNYFLTVDLINENY